MADSSEALDTTLLELRRGDESISLTLVRDPAGQLRALCHGLGFALSHGGALRDTALAEALLHAATQFARLPGPATHDEAVRALRTLITSSVDAAQLRVLQSGSGARPLPRWPSWLRSGEPSASARGIWPFDAELAGLRCGLRKLLKREAFGDQAVATEQRWLDSQAVHWIEAPGEDDQGRRVLLGALDPSILHEAGRAEGELRASGGRSATARQSLGESLGYPECCVRAYVSSGARDDLTLALQLLPRAPAAVASAYSQWLNAPLALISHAPCSLACEASIRLGQRLATALEATSPGFERRWLALARRVHVVTEDGLSLALELEGVLGGGPLVIRRATQLCVPRAADLSDLAQDLDEPIGQELYLDPSGTLRSQDGRFRSVLLADHRG